MALLSQSILKKKKYFLSYDEENIQKILLQFCYPRLRPSIFRNVFEDQVKTAQTVLVSSSEFNKRLTMWIKRRHIVVRQAVFEQRVQSIEGEFQALFKV